MLADDDTIRRVNPGNVHYDSSAFRGHGLCKCDCGAPKYNALEQLPDGSWRSYHRCKPVLSRSEIFEQARRWAESAPTAIADCWWS